jgi:ribonucleases P/MRP protein subunit RPP40
MLVRWITSFLGMRRQRVIVSGFYSEWQPVLSGVPQGSVLGPLLFRIYVDDLDDVLTGGVRIKKFADDTILYKAFSASDAASAAHSMQASIDGVLNWCALWQMPLNVRKCTAMHMGLHNPRTPYTISGEPIAQSEHVRDLGVTISDTLRFSEHCVRASANARKICGLMLRRFKSRSRSVILPIYKTLIRPLLEYATPVWNPVFKKDIAELDDDDDDDDLFRQVRILVVGK